MPRYAIGSLERKIYHDIRKESGTIFGVKKKNERKNSGQSHAHRLEEGLKQSTARHMMATTDHHGPSCADKLRAIRNIFNIYELGCCSADTAFMVIKDIVKD
jgi:hypothetical protein